MIAVEVARNSKDFNCKTCSAKHCDSAGALPDSRGPAPIERWHIDGVISSTTCLLPMINDFSRECLRLYGHYKNGILLRAGGLYDQPRKYMQAMGVIDGC